MKKPKNKQFPKLKPRFKLGKLKRASGQVRPQLARLRRHRAEPDAKLLEAIQNLPRITNETVAEHREEVLSSARKYIYPLSHSRRRIVVITSSLLVLGIVIFFAYCSAALYKFKSTSTFVYGVTQVIPFPVAKAGPSWVSYESYLFELRHSIHYYQTQQNEDFGSASGKVHLKQLEKTALNQVIDDALVKQLAAKHDVSVNTKEVDNQVALLRSQNRLGSSDDVFRSVLSEFWGWTPDDFKRELKQQLLAQKVTANLNTSAQTKAQDALKKLDSGTDFGTLASQVSEDASSRANGGNYGFAITPSNRDLPPQVLQAIFKLMPNQHSDIIDSGYALEIDKLLDKTGTTVHAAHIVFNLQPITTFTKQQQATSKIHTYVSLD